MWLTGLQQSKQGLFGDVGVAHVLWAAFYDAAGGVCRGAGHALALRPNQAAAFERRHIVGDDNGGVALVSGALLLITVTAHTHAADGDIWRES